MNSAETTVFIVDDDKSVLKSLKRLVNSAGYQVGTFESAREFIDSRQHVNTGVLVLDVRMPEMNGLELQQFLIDSGVKIPIIFITAHEDDTGVHQRALGKGAVAFFFKPFDGQELLEAINASIDVIRASADAPIPKMSADKAP